MLLLKIIISLIIGAIIYIMLFFMMPKQTHSINFKGVHENLFLTLRIKGYPDYVQIIFLSNKPKWFEDTMTDYFFYCPGLDDYFYKSDDTSLTIYGYYFDYMPPKKFDSKVKINLVVLNDSSYSYYQKNFRNMGMSLIAY